MRVVNHYYFSAHSRDLSHQVKDVSRTPVRIDTVKNTVKETGGSTCRTIRRIRNPIFDKPRQFMGMQSTGVGHVEL